MVNRKNMYFTNNDFILYGLFDNLITVILSLPDFTQIYVKVVLIGCLCRKYDVLASI